MTSIVYCDFESYIKEAKSIFDIMAVAYKTLYPFETMLSLVQDSVLKDIISRYTERYDTMQAFVTLKEELIEWFYNQTETSMVEIRKKLFFLIRLIDGKCVKACESSLPDSYIQFFSLNDLFQDEIIILPRFKSNAIGLLSKSIEKKDMYGFYGRNYARTADITGYLNNFIVYKKKSCMKPKLSIPNYYKEIEQEFEQKNYKLRVGIFPLSNINLNQIFQIEEDIKGTEGIFCIKSPIGEQESQIFERCKEALILCKEHCVDIAVFPEMLFSKKNHQAVIDFVRKNGEEEKRFPWFMWLGTAWADRENKCIMIDQYGKVVFEQRKHIPYEYKKELEQKAIKESKKTITIREDLVHEDEWLINFLDIPGSFRIATAICRDISDGYLNAFLKELYSDMLIIPAFSKSNLLTGRNIETLALERIITVICNACSSLCEESKGKFEISERVLNKEQPFCYLCMPAKKQRDNAADYHTAKYKSTCKKCEKYCKGHIWEISFSECIIKKDVYSAKVTYLDF